MKNSITAFTKKLCLDLDTRALEEAKITLCIDWSVARLALASAADFTAHNRYQTWYYRVFRGTKRAHSDDEDYEDEEVSDIIRTATPNHPNVSFVTTHPATRSQKARRVH